MTITRRWQSGFETGSTAEFDASTYVDISSAVAKTGTYSARLNVDYTHYFNKNVTATRQLRVGFYFYRTWTVSGEKNIVSFYDGSSNELVSVEGVGSTGDMMLEINGTNQDTELVAMPSSSWIHIGVDLKIDSSAGWVKVYKDGIEILSFSGNTGNADITVVKFGHGSTMNQGGAYTYIDDAYIDDTTSEGAAAVVPLKTFRYITPVTGSPTYAQWDGSDGNSTDNYALVDEVPPNSDTDYVCTNIVDKLDSYQMSTFTLDTGESIQAVIPIAYVKRAGATEQIALGTRYSSTDVIGSDQSPATSYGYKWERQTTKPGGGAWGQSSLDDVEVVIKSRGSF